MFEILFLVEFKRGRKTRDFKNVQYFRFVFFLQNQNVTKVF